MCGIRSEANVDQGMKAHINYNDNHNFVSNDHDMRYDVEIVMCAGIDVT